jgi:quercetin dioxygenase-like cupin family protein
VLRNETETRASVVRFWPGARTGWHTHAGDQLLLIIDGKGLIVSREAVIAARPGMVVRVPAGESHWHGARAETEMSHLAISTGASTYTRRVEDEEHSRADEQANLKDNGH